MNNERYIWDELIKAGYTKEAAAGIIGNLRAESNLRPGNLQNTYERALGMSDSEYTEAVNSGVYGVNQFINDKAGYGLAQWTYKTRKQALYNACFPKIDSLEKQTAYLIKELSWYSALQSILKSGSVRECSDAVLHLYEAPGDQSEAVELRRYGYAMECYERNAKVIKDSFYTWQLNAYKVKENAEKFIKKNKGSFICKKGELYAACYGEYAEESGAEADRATAKKMSKKAFIEEFEKGDKI